MADINGTSGPDTLNGTSGADNIDGLGGNDTLSGGAGNDKVNGGDGNDRLYSDIRLFGPNETYDPGQYPRNSADHFADHDTLNGGIGDDEIFAGYGDAIDGGDGTDTLSVNFLGATSGVTADFRLLGTQASLVVGGSTIANIENVEYIDGSNFDDVLGIYQATSDHDAVVDGNGGNDHIYVSANAGIFGAQISGDDGNDVIDARGNMRGGNFFGGAGDDTIYTGENSRATASGGDGNDTIYAWGTAYGDAGDDHIVMGSPLDVTGATPQAFGGDGNDTISVSTDPDFREPPGSFFAGEGGADTLTGGDGNDYLTSVGFSGNGISGEDTGTEHDKLSGGDGNDHLFAGYGDDVNGGTGTDVLELSLAGATSGVTLNTDTLVSSTALVLGGGTIQHMEGVARLYGSAFADTITVGAASVLPQNSISVLTGDGNDTISDTSGAVQAGGGNGDDRFIAHVAGGSFSGGDGIDTLDYSAFGTSVEADLNSASGPVNAGSDVENITGTAYGDTLTGSFFANVLLGNAGGDSLSGLTGNDTLRGGAGDDVLAGGDGNDILDGGAGTDTADYGSAASGVSVDLALTAAQATGQGSDTLSGIERLVGSGFDDSLKGTANTDYLEGGAGNDTLDGRGGTDRLTGGLGNDTYHVDQQADLVFENAGEGTDTVNASAGFYLYANIENLNLDSGAGDIFGVGNDLANKITGNEGANLLIAGAANDTVHGGSGGDSLFGQDGADKLYGDAGIDYLVGGIGNDTLDGGADADALYGEDGNDTLWGGTTFDTDILVGGAGDDILHGDSGLADYDRMNGGDGNDTYYVDTGDDLTFEAANGGTDTVYANVAGANNGVYLYANVENLVLLGTTTFGVGNELANVLTGNDSANWLLGGDGNDTLNGKAGGDVLFGQGGSDTFVFEHGTGGDVIGDFVHGEDKMDVHAFGFASFADLQSHFAQVGGDGAIYLDSTGSDFIVLQHTDMATLDAGDFVL